MSDNNCLKRIKIKKKFPIETPTCDFPLKKLSMENNINCLSNQHLLNMSNQFIWSEYLELCKIWMLRMYNITRKWNHIYILEKKNLMAKLKLKEKTFFLMYKKKCSNFKHKLQMYINLFKCFNDHYQNSTLGNYLNIIAFFRY